MPADRNIDDWANNPLLSHPDYVDLVMRQHDEMQRLFSRQAAERLQLALSIRRELERDD